MRYILKDIKNFNIKNSITVFKRDIEELFSNKIVLYIMIGLCVLPSFYAWFNIYASWDPYKNSANLKVAIVNEDLGAEILNQSYNAGNLLEDNLKKNNGFDWQFLSKKDAIEKINTGEIYAYILIPQNFSKDISSILSKDVRQAKLDYFVNEKINAIAPKFTEKGADTIKNKINEEIVGVLVNKVLSGSSIAGYAFNQSVPKLNLVYESLKNLRKNIDEIDVSLGSLKNYGSDLSSNISKKPVNLDEYQSKIDNAKSMANQVNIAAEKLDANVKNIQNLVDRDLSTLNALSTSSVGFLSNMKSMIDTGSSESIYVMNNLGDKLNTMQNINQSILNFYRAVHSFFPNRVTARIINRHENLSSNIERAINTLNTLKEEVSGANSNSQETLSNLQTILNDINNQAFQVTSDFRNGFTPVLNSMNASTIKMSKDAQTALDKAAKIAPSLKTVMDQSPSINKKTGEKIDNIRSQLPVTKELLDLSIADMEKLLSSDEIKTLSDVLQFDVYKRAEFIKNPVDLRSKSIYHIENYGTAMSPFYTVLACWVGIVLLSAIIGISTKDKFRPSEIFLGRMYLYLLIGVIQAAICAIGDLLILKITVEHPILFILAAVYVSIIFCIIIYSLVSLFGNLGKGIAIIMLVLQIGSSGGTFPIQVVPGLFRFLSPLLPFTYSVSLLRETIAGIYMKNLVKDVVMMFIIALIFLLVYIILKRPTARNTEKLQKRFHNSRLSA